MPDSNLPTVNVAQRLGEFIQEAALNPSFDADKFTQVVRLHIEIQDRQDKGDFNEAFAAVQGELEPIVRTAENRHLGNKYAGLDAVDAVLRPVCRKHGLSSRFGSMEGAPDGWTRKTLTVSLGRYSETIWLDFPSMVRGSQGGRTQMNEQQQVGAVSTYARRYLLQEFFNLATMANKVDDTDVDTGDGDGGTKTKTDTGTKTKTDTGTRTDANPPDPATLFPSVARNLARATTVAHVDSLQANAQVMGFRAQQTPANQALIDKMFADRRAALLAAPPPPPPNDLPDNLDLGEKPPAPSELLTRILARIKSCETLVALDSCAIAPEFTTDMAKLSAPEGDQATEAMQARARELGAK